jgi:hypothetical protein
MTELCPATALNGLLLCKGETNASGTNTSDGWLALMIRGCLRAQRIQQQENGTDDEILQFCERSYEVAFPLANA